MKSAAVQPQSQHNLIPNFCSGEAVGLLVVVMQMMAVVLTLLSTERGEAALERLTLVSLYLQSMGLSSAMVLCLARRWLKLARVGVVFFVCWGLLVLVTLVISDASWWIAGYAKWPPMTAGRMEFIVRSVAISAILSLLLLRYFWGRAQLQVQARADSEARYLALQARIRPHFLFNSLNSIAALISTRPEQAEEMVVDLADLFRVSLDARNRLVKVSEEVEFVKIYLRIEQVRLGDKLWVNWDIAPDTTNARTPLLILQPLVENAVHHGVSRLRGRGGINVTVRREQAWLIIDVENPIPPEDAPKRESTGVALENIAQRLKLIYGEAAKLIQGPERTDTGPVYRARIQIPYTTEETSSEQAQSPHGTGDHDASSDS